ncbi:RhoGAP-domain-containing protein [Rhizoclosmatium globosum]|uniref:RhoGAP-domain-containing protein n=1 Tax=Rhizoclosmatium globosum TaxID=329046 RepID=A0A1Y2CJJ9_9FUNG|nr:RhoGAP-domain-containing protein [Rhizoclosmatium globosum]|eukprot:ORY47208.1 RhoGAP-domain-containing protein [Rhizoclosmatium globosum]
MPLPAWTATKTFNNIVPIDEPAVESTEVPTVDPKRLSTTLRKQAPEPPPSRRSVIMGDTTSNKRTSLVSQTPPAEETLSEASTQPPQTAPLTLVVEDSTPTPPNATPISSPPRDPFSDEITSPDEKSSPDLGVEDALDSEDGFVHVEKDTSSPVKPADAEIPLDSAQEIGDSLTSITSQNGSKWKPMKDTSGQIYYWNESTNHTTWDAPIPPANQSREELQSTPNISFNNLTHPRSTPALTDTTPPVISGGGGGSDHDLLADADLDLTRFDSIPVDLIKKEGNIKYKIATDAGGKHGLLQSSWKACHGVLCVGVLFLVKEGGGMGKNKKLLTPIDAIVLSHGSVEAVGKDQTSKKNAFMITSSSGRHRLFMSDSDANTAGWIEAVKECMKEKHTAAEYEAVISRVFSKAKPPLPGQITISDPIQITSPATNNTTTTASNTTPPAPNSQLRPEAAATRSPNAGTAPAVTTTRRSINVFGAVTTSKMPSFFGGGKKSPSVVAPSKPSAAAEAVSRPELPFGGLLDVQLQFEGREVPMVVEMCVLAVEAREGIECQGIYRLSGNSATIGKLKVAFNHGETVDLSTEDDINVITGLLKSYFRELQNPLIPFEVYDQFIASSKIQDYNERLIQLKTLIQALPTCNYNVLSYLLKHLKKIAENSEVNKMEQSNLAIVFAPTLIRTPEGTGDAAAVAQQGYASMANMPFHNKLIESMIEQYDWLFDGSKE